MSIFGHISVFISIILGLGVVHLLSGVSLILDARVSAKLYWVHICWTVSLLFVMILVWISSFILSPLAEMGALHFLNLMAYSIVAYLMSGLLFPVQGSEVTDFTEHFEANRSRLYALGIIFVIVDALDGVLEHFKTNIPWDIGQFGTLAVWLIMFITGLLIRNKKLDGLIVLIFLVGLAGWFVSIIDSGVLVW